MPDPNLTTPPNCIQPMNRASFKKTNSDGIIRWQWRYRNISGERLEYGYELSYAAMQIGDSITRSEIAARIRMARNYLKQHIAKDLADFDLEQRKRDVGVIDFLARAFSCSLSSPAPASPHRPGTFHQATAKGA
jgi:hypothetical protein